MSDKDDLLTRWLNQRDIANRAMAQNASDVNVSRHQNPPKHKSSAQTTPQKPPAHLASPHLTGKLADHLEQQAPRIIQNAAHQFSSENIPWTAEDLSTRAAITTALILTSHIIRFANTKLSAQHLIQARDSLLRSFKADDAVYMEVEAYELLQWLAAAIDSNWQPKTSYNEQNTIAETSEDALIQIISNAIHYQHDLEMKYYTGSSGKFSKRRITPIEITAEKFLIAYCHLRQEERVFRLSRIVTLCPADNAPEHAPKLCYPSLSDTTLPPLPQTPSTEMPQIPPTHSKTTHSTSKSHKKTSKTPQHSAQSQSPQNTDIPKTSKPNKTKKKSAPKTTSTTQSPTLFSLFPETQPETPPQNTPKKKTHQRLLPGLDES